MAGTENRIEVSNWGSSENLRNQRSTDFLSLCWGGVKRNQTIKANWWVECIDWVPDISAMPVRPAVLKDACRLDVTFVCFASPMPKLLDLIGGSAGNGSGGCNPNAKTVCVVRSGLVYPM